MLLVVVAVVLMGVPPAEEEMLMATVCPFGAPVVVPEMVTEESSTALSRPSPPSSMATEMVGGRVSMEMVTELLASEPSTLVLPAASENLELATEMTPSVVLSAVGVKVAE